MALGAFAHGHEAPLVVGSEELHASVGLGVGAEVQPVAVVVAGVVVRGVEVLAVGRLAAERAHFVAAVGCEAAVAHEEVVVVSDMLDVGPFATAVVASGDALAEVGVGEGTSLAVGLQRIGVGVVAQARLLV